MIDKWKMINCVWEWKISVSPLLSASLSLVSPTISLFLVQLDKSAEALQDYGIVVGKVTKSSRDLPNAHQD